MSWRGAAVGLMGRAIWGLGLGLGPAAAEILDCRMSRGRGAEGLIAPQYLFDHEADALVAQVYDGLIHVRLGRPQLARVRAEATRLVLTWTVQVRDRWNEPQTAAFRAELSLQTGALQVEARLAGAFMAEGEGLCAPAEG